MIGEAFDLYMALFNKETVSKWEVAIEFATKVIMNNEFPEVRLEIISRIVPGVTSEKIFEEFSFERFRSLLIELLKIGMRDKSPEVSVRASELFEDVKKMEKV